jgi:hypothetical protein
MVECSGVGEKLEKLGSSSGTAAECVHGGELRSYRFSLICVHSGELRSYRFHTLDGYHRTHVDLRLTLMAYI